MIRVWNEDGLERGRKGGKGEGVVGGIWWGGGINGGLWVGKKVGKGKKVLGMMGRKGEG